MLEKNFAKNVVRLFKLAALAWERGNNGVDALGRPVAYADKAANLVIMESECERLQKLAEAKLRPLGITVDYPGLYPRFKFAGREYHELGEALRAVCEAQNPAPRGWASV